MNPYRRPRPDRRAKAARLHRQGIGCAIDAAIDRILRRTRRRSLAREESAGLVPARLTAHDVFGVQVELLSAIRFAMPFDPAADLRRLIGRQRLAHGDTVLHVNQSEEFHRKRFGAEHREVQRHRKDVWIGNRQRGARRCPADLRILREVPAIDRDLREARLDARHFTAIRYQRRLPRHHDLRVHRPDGRRAREFERMLGLHEIPGNAPQGASRSMTMFNRPSLPT